MAHSSSAFSFTHCGRYTTAGGEREVAAAYDPDRGVWVLVDAFQDAKEAELDAHVIDDTLASPAEARALATDYLARAHQAGGPLVS